MSIFNDILNIFRNNNMEPTNSLMDTIKYIIDDCKEKGTNGKAPNYDDVPDVWGDINLIPSEVKGVCCRELLILCYDKDKFDQRLRDMLYCAGIVCRDINKVAIFLTSRWDPSEYAIHKDAVDALQYNGVKVMFIMISTAGASELRV